MDSNATQSLVSQMTDLIWRNLSRTVENNRMVSSVQTDCWDMGHGRFYHEYRSGNSEYITTKSRVQNNYYDSDSSSSDDYEIVTKTEVKQIEMSIY